MKRHETIYALLVSALFFHTAFGGESKNLPKESEVEAALQLAGNGHSNIGDIQKLGSHKTEKTYFHIYSGKVNERTFRVIIFDNNDQYLGYYDSETYAPTSYDKMTGILYCHDCNKIGFLARRWIPLGGQGPWEQVGALSSISPKGPFFKPDIISFNPTSAYKKPVISTEVRTWVFGKDDLEIEAKLAGVNHDMVYIQNIDEGYVTGFNKSFLSSKDKQYLRGFD